MKRITVYLIALLFIAQLTQAKVLILKGGYYIADVEIIANNEGEIIFEHEGEMYKLHNDYIFSVKEHIPTHGFNPLNVKALTDPGKNLESFSAPASAEQTEPMEEAETKPEAITLEQASTVTPGIDNFNTITTPSHERQARFDDLSRRIGGHRVTQIVQTVFGIAGLGAGALFAFTGVVGYLNPGPGVHLERSEISDPERNLIIGTGSLILGVALLNFATEHARKAEDLESERDQFTLTLKPEITSKLTGMKLELAF